MREHLELQMGCGEDDMQSACSGYDMRHDFLYRAWSDYYCPTHSATAFGFVDYRGMDVQLHKILLS